MGIPPPSNTGTTAISSVSTRCAVQRRIKYGKLWSPGHGNYLRFADVTGSTLTITGILDPDFVLPLDGLQIVEVPEPATLVLASLIGVIALAAAVRRRMRPRHSLNKT